MLLRKCCCCCAVPLCAAWSESWAYPAGVVPDPPWSAPFGPGTELVATGAGTATSGAGATVGTRLHDGGLAWGYTGSFVIDNPVIPAWFTVSDAGLASQLGVQWDGAGNWVVLGPGGGGVSGHVGASVTFVLQWNAAGDWSVTVGAEPPMTGVGMPPIPGGFALIYAPGAAPSSTFSTITALCDELP